MNESQSHDVPLQNDIGKERLANLLGVYETLANWGLHPKILVIGSYRRYGLKGDKDTEFLPAELKEGEQRPIWNFVSEGNEGKRSFVKAVVDPKDESVATYHDHRTEALFYQLVRNKVVDENRVKEINVDMPVLERVNEDKSVIAISLVDGADVANQHYEVKANLKPETANTIHKFILSFHDKSLAQWRQEIPEFANYFPLDATGDSLLEKELNNHRLRFESRKAKINELVGNEYIGKMEKMLEEGSIFFKLDPSQAEEDQLTLLNPNMNAGSFMEGNDGKIYAVDWQSFKISHPVTASAYFIETLWNNPELYDRTLTDTLEKFKGDRNAIEMLRYELAFLRLSGVAVRFYRPVAEDSLRSQEDRDHAKNAMEVLGNRLKEAIDKTGVWAKFYSQDSP